MEFDEIEKLLTAAANGWASPEEVQQLNDLLLADPDLRERAADWFCDESLLHEEAAFLDVLQSHSGHSVQPAADVARDNASPSRGAAHPFSLLSTMTGAALACSLLLNLWLWNREPVSHADAAAKVPGSRLVKATGCVWGSSDGSLQPRLGRRLTGGDALQLIQGIAEFEVGKGGVSGRVRLQGPASAVLRADGMPILRFGRLVADLNVYGEPFWMDTPLGPVEVSDSASIGVEASTDAVAIHVFDGLIVLPGASEGFAGLDREGDSDAVIVQEGEAISLQLGKRAARVLERIAADSGVFAEELSMATDQLALGADYAKLVLDSSPSGYWRFEEPLMDSLLKDEVDGDLTLKVVGSVTRVRQSNNHVLEFGMTRESGFLVSEGLWPREPLDSYTLEMWFKPSHFHSGSLLTLVNPQLFPGNREVNAVIIEIGGPHNLVARRTPFNSIRFVNRSPATPGVSLGQECHVDQYSVREWQHLAAVKDKEKLRLHLNGKVVATARDDRAVPKQMSVILGQIYNRRPERRFIGQLDEFTVYKHALPEMEILRHYQFGSQGQVGSQPPSQEDGVM